MTDTQSPQQVFKQMNLNSWISQAIYVAAELGIADLLVEGPRTAEELAEQTNVHSGALYRLLRALASVDIFSEDTQYRFSLTPLAENLRSDISNSQRSFAIMMGAEFYQTWGHILHSVQTGKPAFDKRFGMPIFQYLTENPERGKIFDATMTDFQRDEIEPMLNAYDFSQFNTVIDIGGGNGQVLFAILNRYPDIRGVLFDLPSMIERARQNAINTILSERYQMVSGDFFVSVPTSGNAYVMRRILHDWNDEKAVTILRHCRDAMHPSGKVLAIENVIPPGNDPNFGKWLDLMMLAIGGQERTEEQYRLLFSKAGLTLNRIISTSTDISIIEGVRTE